MRPGGLITGDRIEGDLAKPDGAGPFPAVVGLHGRAGMHDTTKQRLAEHLVARGYVVLLVDSYATRGINHACTSTAAPPSSCAGRMPGALWSGSATKASAIHIDGFRCANPS